MKEILAKHDDLLNEIAKEAAAGQFFDLDLQPLLSEYSDSGKVWVLGAGKASVAMAREVERFFGDRICDGIVIAPETSREFKDIQVFKGAHPYPDTDSVASSLELMSLARKIPEGDTVIFCLSGGASSLYCIPSGDIELEELQETYKLLLNSGASIHQMNVVRKHLSDTAGGKTAAALSGTRLFSIIVSDVPDDDPQCIGSGPTVADKTTFKEAFQVLKKTGIWEKVPHSVRIHITRGMEKEVKKDADVEVQSNGMELQQDETTNTFDAITPLLELHRVEVISGARTLAKNIGEKLSTAGFKVRVAEKAYDEDIRHIAKHISSDGISVLSRNQLLEKPAALLYFGESTVQVNGDGKGGRNQELALIVALSIEGQHHISLLSLGTDGVDGPTDAAGAIINSETVLLARKMKLDPEVYLQENNSYYFHQQMKNLVKTGPTGNNLMDLQILLVE